MHLVVEEPSPSAYRDAVEQVLERGARRVLWRGEGPLARDVWQSMADHRRAAGTRWRWLTEEDGAAGPAEVSTVARDEAESQRWDAVVVFEGTAVGAAANLGLASVHLADDLVHSGRRPEFLAMVSIHKSGTNLAAEMLRAFGYRLFGHGVVSSGPKPEPGLPPWDREWEYLSSAPPFSCYVTHSLPLFTGDYRTSRPLVKLWSGERFPLLFNYRDPRAVLCSYVRYVLGQGRSEEYTASPFTTVCSETLQAIGDPGERLRVAIQILGDYFTWAYRDHLWLLHHPQVCRTSYEVLSGREAGGDERSQVRQVAEVMAYLRVPGEPRNLAARIYNPEARTFSRGKAYSWREELGPEHHREFNDRYRDILKAYGYPPVDAG